MINWGSFQTLPSFSPIRNIVSNGTSGIITDKFIDEPGIDPDELRTGIRAEWETCGGDANLAKKIAIKNIKEDPHYYSGLHKYGVDEDHVVTNKKINPLDLFKGMEFEKQLGLSSREAAKKCLKKISKGEDGKYPDPRVMYGDYTGETDADAVLQEEHAKKYPYGMIETWKFFEMGSDSDLGTFNDLLKRGKYDDGWEFLKSVTEIKDPNVDGLNQELTANSNKMTTVTENKIQGTSVSALVDETIDPAQLAMGITVEMEHTDNDKVAAELAKDHLEKDGNYYTKLQKAGLADECSPVMSSGLGDASHALNKEFRIGKDMTPTAGNNIVGNMGNTPSTKTVGKKDYTTMETPSSPKTHTKLTTYKDLKKLAEGAKMVGRWTIAAYPTNGENNTPQILKEIHKRFDAALTEDTKGLNPIPVLMEIALEYESNKDKAFKIVQNWMYEGTDFLTGKRKKKIMNEGVFLRKNMNETVAMADPYNGEAIHAMDSFVKSRESVQFDDLENIASQYIKDVGQVEKLVNEYVTHRFHSDKQMNENTAGYPMSKDAITSKIKENQSASKKKKDQIEEDAERFSRQHCMLSPSMLGRHMHENDANRITSVRKTLSEIYRACQTPSITESSSEQMLTVEGVGKMNISNIKETIAKKMSEMIRLAECGDYAALTKHTTNGQLSVLESIKKSILANLKEAPAPISAAAVPVSPGITESKRSKSIYSRFFKE
jgi:hypothetical protein